MTITDIYEQFQPASLGFIVAVETHCGYEISRNEIERIAEKSETASAFARIWENENWWNDTNNG